MGVAGRPLFQKGVDEQGADLERVFACSRAGGVAGLLVGHALGGSQYDDVDLPWRRLRRNF